MIVVAYACGGPRLCTNFEGHTISDNHSADSIIQNYLVIRIHGEYDVVKIVTSYLQTPNAVRDLDWIAYAENWQTGDPIGNGATEHEAIDRLREELEFRVHSAITGEVDEED
jgi:hypothetical protein